MEDSKPLARLPLEIIFKILGYANLGTLYAALIVSKALSQEAESIIKKRINVALKIVEEIVNSGQSTENQQLALIDAIRSEALVIFAALHYDSFCNYKLFLGQSRLEVQEIADSHPKWIRSITMAYPINFVERVSAAFKWVDAILSSAEQSDSDKRQLLKGAAKSNALVVIALLCYEATAVTTATTMFNDNFSLVQLSSQGVQDIQEIADSHQEAWVKQIIYQKSVYKALKVGDLQTAHILKCKFGVLPNPKILEPVFYAALAQGDFRTARALNNDFGVLLDPKLLKLLVFEALDKGDFNKGYDFKAELPDPKLLSSLLVEVLEEEFYTRTNRP
jgi:hypothetical protein